MEPITNTCTPVHLLYLSLWIRASKLDQGVLHSIEHVRFIGMLIGGYLHYQHCFKVCEPPLLVFVKETCAVLKSLMEVLDIIVHTCSFRKDFPRDCMPQLKCNYVDKAHI